MKRRVAVCLIGALAALAPVQGAFGDASNKQPGFESDSDSDGGLQLLGDAGVPVDVLSIGSSESDSSTAKDVDSTSSAEATPIEVLGFAPVEAQCDSSGAEAQGADRQSESTELATIPVGDVATVTLLPAECDTRAVKTNNAQGTAETAVVEAEALPDESGEPQVTVGVLTSESDAKTTSGQSNSGSEFSVVEGSVMGEELSLVTCESDSFQNNGQDTTQTTESTTLVAGTEIPLSDPLCSSGAIYERTPPAM